MKRFILVLTVLVAISPIAHAQSESERQKQIDIQVWKPFHAAFEARNATALNSIYAEEVLRVTADGVDTNNKFKQLNIESYTQASGPVSLDFWFDSRQTNEDTSYEIGIFKIGIGAKEDKNYIYGQFHIVIKNINGVWKITQDWDSQNVHGKPITAADFTRKPALKF